MILEHYMYTIPELFSPEEVDEIHEIAKNLQTEHGMTGMGKGMNADDPPNQPAPNITEHVRKSTIKWIKDIPDHLRARIDEGMSIACGGANWPFELVEMQTLQYTIYEGSKNTKGDFYTWHSDDGIEGYEDGMKRKLSFVIQLSDPEDYEGGNFQWLELFHTLDQIQRHEKTINIENAIQTLPFSCKHKGSMFVFPSFVHHQVTPVTHGVRTSLVGWFLGYPYK